MSADNYWRICKHPAIAGKYTAVMGFASDPEEVQPDEKSPVFDTILEARDYAAKDPIIEYGIHVDRECLAVLDQRNELDWIDERQASCIPVDYTGEETNG
ncbi:hypothetical protein SEA_JUMBO_77 [Gordonia phage Jumbo]|uniref:Uncharacterized protein n=1 Tax=Gordonia phage Jumbo TaxID=1887650 RepID=A0A1B3B0P5_9CAUD|nr:hypothetical protein BIZ69_gp077 [Gordonia phage Jumbo]AOE44585.1 hypothetical protein SEA_JUMBO_77 [Gordonia phage Jumbo]